MGAKDPVYSMVSIRSYLEAGGLCSRVQWKRTTLLVGPSSFNTPQCKSDIGEGIK